MAPLSHSLQQQAPESRICKGLEEVVDMEGGNFWGESALKNFYFYHLDLVRGDEISVFVILPPETSLPPKMWKP